MKDPPLATGSSSAPLTHSATFPSMSCRPSAPPASPTRRSSDFTTRRTLALWIERLRTQTGDGFPGKVTAFREEMAVHGRYREPCPACGAPVQRIRYAENEVNYCAACQTGGKVLADRAFSRLLKDDWPRSLDEWEERFK